jgi:hypothetical protein
MIEFIDEVVSVESRLRPGGGVWPLAFSWRGRRFEVKSWGRQSTEKQAGRRVRRYLVQTAGPETWELGQDVESGQWKLLRHWARRGRVRTV